MKLDKITLETIKANNKSLSLVRISDSKFEIVHHNKGYFSNRTFESLSEALDYFYVLAIAFDFPDFPNKRVNLINRGDK